MATRFTTKKTGPSVLTWEDDPISTTPARPISAPVPSLGKSPYSLALSGKAPAPKAYPKGTGDFRYWDAAVALRRGADFWGAPVPAGTTWQPGGTLKVTLDHGVDLNAYYDRKGLWFFHDTVAGTTVYSGESPDVLCHEQGHAILDSIRPELWDAMSAEVAAFHESFGDMSSILAGLQVPSLRAAVLSETGGTLYRNSRLSRLAEQLGWAIRQIQPDAVDPDCLRNAVNSFFYRDPLSIPDSGPASHLTSEPHSFSRVFTAGFFEALGGMAATIASPATDAALVTASRDAGTLLVDAVRSAPVAAGYYSQVAAHMVSADQSHFSGKYSQALKSAFVRRGILSLKSVAELKPESLRRADTTRGRSAAAAPAGLSTLALAAGDFALGAGRIYVQAASASPLFRVASAASAVSAAGAAKAFLAYLFRRGRIDLAGHGDTATRVEHRLARKTHDLVRHGPDYSVVRRTFDCGFEFA
ncbi:MAG: hypothetical protein ACHQPI_08655 [Thermoanaerobaculia bacterium]